MNKRLWMAGTCMVLGTVHPLMAQPASNPAIWTWNKPLGNAASDSRFRPMVNYHLGFGLMDNTPSTPAVLVNRDGTSVGTAIADEVLRRAENNPVILLRGTGQLNVYLPPGAIGTYGNYTALYDYNVSSIDTDRVQVGTQWFRFLWMTKGIAAQTAWTDDFLAAYEAEVGYDPDYAPERLVFDQEPPSTVFELGTNANWATMLNFWTAVQGDPRWDTTPVPGYGSQTLSDLWTAASISGPVAYAGDGRFVGGGQQNQDWFRWLLEVEQTAIASAMDEAFYSRVAARGGIWSTVKCCDYDGTMRNDGLADDYTEPANANTSSTELSTLGPAGVRYAQNCSGTNIVQAPHLYTDSGFKSWYFFNSPSASRWSPDPCRWANTDDLHSPDYNRPGPLDSSGNPTVDEFWSETSRRYWRFRLDGCSKSSGGSNIPIDAWVTLPNQALSMAGINTHWYDGQYYAQSNMAVRQSFRSTLDSLALCKAHRVDHLLLWNDTEAGNQHGPHSQFDKNWNYFQRAVDLVWGINVTDFTVDSSNTLPQGYSQSTRVDKVSYADGSVSTDATNRVQVNSATNGGVWAVTKFQMSSGLATSGNRPESLNFAVDVVMNQDTHLHLFIWDWNLPGWRDIGDSAVSGYVADMDGREYPVAASANKTMRLQASIPYLDDYRSPSGSGYTNTIMFAVFATPDVGGTQTAYFDMVQCYGGDEGNETRWRPLGDFNGDYEVDCDDSTMFTDLFTNYPTAFARWLDFNRDGVVNSTDSGLWTSNYLGQTRKVDDYKRSSVDSR